MKITGNTYPVKEQLKLLGARWNKDARAWEIEEAYAAQAQAIVDSQRAPETRVCWECGIPLPTPNAACAAATGPTPTAGAKPPPAAHAPIGTVDRGVLLLEHQMRECAGVLTN